MIKEWQEESAAFSTGASGLRGVSHNKLKKTCVATASDPTTGKLLILLRLKEDHPNAEVLCAQEYDRNELKWWGRWALILKPPILGTF